MEDEGFVDDDFIGATVLQFLALYGTDGLAMLRERAAIADATGDYLLAQTWREIVAAAVRAMG